MTIEQQQQSYARVHSLSLRARHLRAVLDLLGWDQETYMPPSAAQARAEQRKILASLVHQEQTSKQFAEALAALIDLKTGEIKAKNLNAAQQAALQRWRRDYRRQTALPTEFVEEFTAVTSQAIHAWGHAKEADAFHQFAPFLEKIILLVRKKAELLGYEEHPYDALLEEYEPGATSSQISSLFGELRGSISHLLKEIRSKKQVDDSCLKGHYPKDLQIKFGNEILQAMGFSFERGRLDSSNHPFSSTFHPSDSRITTRILEHNVMSHIKTSLHEGGHSLYEMNLPTEHYGSPLGEYLSLGVHESQSRFWETRIGLSRPFWTYYLPKLQAVFDGPVKSASLDEFYKAINKVEPSFIRVEADEVTYPLHVILRFELEKALVEGSLNVRDIPAAWNAKMQELLGVTPENNRKGCLQDIHWSMGAFGYFPTYTLGNIFAAHLFEKFANDYPKWEERVARGELAFIREWLTKQVHQHGRRYQSAELLELATGQPLSSAAYNRYLQTKYGEVYGL